MQQLHLSVLLPDLCFVSTTAPNCNSHLSFCKWCVCWTLGLTRVQTLKTRMKKCADTCRRRNAAFPAQMRWTDSCGLVPTQEQQCSSLKAELDLKHHSQVITIIWWWFHWILVYNFKGGFTRNGKNVLYLHNTSIPFSDFWWSPSLTLLDVSFLFGLERYFSLQCCLLLAGLHRRALIWSVGHSYRQNDVKVQEWRMLGTDFDQSNRGESTSDWRFLLFPSDIFTSP